MHCPGQTSGRPTRDTRTAPHRTGSEPLFDQEVSRWRSLYRESSGERWAVFQKQAAQRAMRRRARCAELLNARYGEYILDVGCGSGHFGSEVARRGAAYVGVDLSMGMLGSVRQLFEEGRLQARLVRADAFRLPFASKKFDGAICVGVVNYHRPREIGALLTELARVCRSVGRLVISAARFDPFNWIRSRLYGRVPRPLALPGPLYTMPRRSFRSLLAEAGWTIERRISARKYRWFPHYDLFLARRGDESAA
jgi:SAM-dependent methyltransferase